MRIFSKNNNNDLSPSRFNLPQLDPTMKRRIGVSSSKSQASSYGYGRYSYLPSTEFCTEIVENNEDKVGFFSMWRSRLSKVSNIASLLCVVDCTVLPIVTVIFPMMGLVASPARMHWLHELGHAIAMRFVIPVGGFAAFMNYLSHKMPLLSLPALMGLSLIYLANGHGGPILSRLPHELAHSLHCGTVLHRMTNIIGCALLLGSNYVSHRASCSHDKSCGHSGCRTLDDAFFKWDKSAMSV